MTPPIPPVPSIFGDALTPEDVERARVAWERSAPPQLRHLLDAEPEPPPEPTP